MLKIHMSTQKHVYNYDLEQIITCQGKNTEEVFFITAAYLALGDIEFAKLYLERKKTMLHANGAFELLEHTVLFATGEDKVQSFVQALEKIENYKSNKNVYAFYNFFVGFYFLRRKKMNIALEYYKKALSVFQETNHIAWIWRTKFNMFLCNNYTNSFLNFDDDFKNLMNNFSNLPYPAKKAFSIFIVWLLLFRRRYQEAYNLCLSFQDAPLSQDYRMYLEFILNKENTMNSEGPFQEILTYIKSESPSFIEVLLKFDQFHTRQKFLLFHSYIYKKYKQCEYEDVIFLSKTHGGPLQDDGTLIIQPFSILEIVLFSAVKLRKERLVNETLAQIKIEEPWWTYQYCLKKTERIKREINKQAITFDMNSSKLYFNQNCFDISKLKKIVTLVHSICSSGESCGVNDLAKSVYGKTSPVEQVRNNLVSLLSRLNKILGVKIYDIQGDLILFRQDYPFIIKKKRGAKRILDKKMLFEEFRKQPERIFTSSDLAKIFNVSSRLINKIIIQLLKDDNIKKNGKGRVSRYLYSKG